MRTLLPLLALLTACPPSSEDTTDTDTDTLGDDLVTATFPVADGLCERSGFCWEGSGGPDVYLHDLNATSADTAWMRGEWLSVIRWSDGEWLRTYVDVQLADLAAVNDDVAWGVADGAVYRFTVDGAERFDAPEGYGQSIATDGEGTLWLSGTSGILEGNGVEWQALDTDASGSVRWLQSELWVGDYGYADRYDGAEWARFFGSDDSIDEIDRGPDGQVYMGSYTRGEVYRLDDDFVMLEGTNGFGTELAAVTGGVWTTLGDGVLNHFNDDGAHTTLQLPEMLREIEAIGEQLYGVAAPGVLMRVVDGVPQDLNPGLRPGLVSTFHGDSLTDLWAATERGVLHRDGTEWTLTELEGGARAVTTVGDTVYAAQWDGLVVMQDGRSTTLPLPGEHWGLSDVVADVDGTVFVASRDGILELVDGVLVDTNAVSDQFVYGFGQGEAGLFAQLATQLLQRTEDGWDTVRLPFGMSSGDIAVTDQVWLIGESDNGPGLFVLDGDDWQSIAFDTERMPHPSRLAVYGDELWMSTTNGRQLGHLVNGEWTIFDGESDIRSLWLGADGAAYGTFYGGIAVQERP